MLLGEALAQLWVPRHVGPELEEDGQPAFVVPLLEARDQPLHSRIDRFAAGERRLDLLDSAVTPLLVYREEQVLLRREVR